jgi:predicted transport protein
MSNLDLDDFFNGSEASRQLFDAILCAVDDFGEMTDRPSKSQVAFRCKKNFAVVWIPG